MHFKISPVFGVYEGCPSKSWTFVITRDFVPGILRFFMMCSYISRKHFVQIWLIYITKICIYMTGWGGGVVYTAHVEIFVMKFINQNITLQ